MFCKHQWKTRSGYDSGSVCEKCGAMTDREIDLEKSEKNGRTVLKDSAFTHFLKTAFPELFCKHKWKARSAYDSGYICVKCHISKD